MDKMSIDEIIKQAEIIKKNADKKQSDAQNDNEHNLKSVKADNKKSNVLSDNEPLDDVKQFIKENKENKESIKSDIEKNATNTPITSNEKTVKINLFNDKATSVNSELDKTRVIPKSKERTVVINNRDDHTKVIPKANEHTKIISTSDDHTRVINKYDDRPRPAIISTNSKKDEKSDLNEIPTIFAVNHLDDAFKYRSTDDGKDEELGVQMTLEGFDDEIETVPSIDEEIAERALKKNREDKINKFRLFGPNETDKNLNQQKVVDNDYINEADKNDILSNLLYTRTKTKSKIFITSVLGLLLLLMTAFKDKGFFPAFLSEHLVYFSTALVLYVGILITNFNIIIHAFKFKGGLNFDFITMLNALIVLIHSTLLVFYENLWLDNGILLSCVSSFALLLSQIGKYKMINQIIDNFDYLINKDEKFTVENITNEIDSKIISRGIINEKPIIKTSVKTDFPTNFLDISCKTEPADKIANPLSLITLGISFVLFLYIGFTDNFNTAFNIFVCAICASNPIIALYATNSAIADITKESSKHGARVCGYEGALITNNSNVMVMEAADFFDRSCCDNHGIKIFNNTKIDEAILYTATVMIKTKSPLAHVFDDVIIGKQSILPEVEDILYENKLGTSAWVYGKKVLVGNRNLLIAHGVTVPKESYEKKYTQKNKHALYLAVNGKICAMFIFSYSANPELKQELKKLEKSGITIIVRSCDPYINEETLCNLFDLPSDFIKVMNPSAARVYEKYSNMTVEKSPAYVIHDGTALSFVSAMKSAEDLISTNKLIKFLSTFGSAIGLGIIAFLAVTNEYSQITAMGTLSFHIIWSAFIVIVSKIKQTLF